MFENNQLTLDGAKITAGNDATLINAIETKGDVTGRGNSVDYINSESGNFKAVLLGSNTGNALAEENSMTVTGGNAGDVADELPSKFNNIATAEVRSYAGTAVARKNTLTLNGLSSANVATAGRTTLYTNGTLALSEGNILTANADSYAGQLISGYAWARNTSGEAQANSNTLNINTSTDQTISLVASGYAQSSQGSSSANDNNLTISTNVSITSVLASFAYATGSGETSARGNSVVIDGAATIETLYGARTYSTSGSVNGSSMAVDNSIVINTGVISTVYGGQAVSASESHANQNTVIVQGGTIQDIYGGYATTTTGTNPEYFESSGNTVILAGGEITGTVYGGAVNPAASQLESRDNTVVLYGDTVLTNAHLIGGNYESNGNILRVVDYFGKVGSINNFESIDVLIGSKAFKQDDPVLEVGTALTEKMQVNVSVVSPKDLHTGDSVHLVSVNENTMDLSMTDNMTESELPSKQTNSIDLLIGGDITILDPVYDYDFNFVTEENSLLLCVNAKEITADTSVLSAGQAAAAIDLDRGINLVMNYFNNDFNTANGLFVIVGSGKDKFDRWGSLEVDGSNAIFGAMSKMMLGDAKLTISSFIDYGQGDYEAKNGGYAKGDMKHYGLGVYGKIQNHGYFADASIRGGRAETEFINILNDVSIGENDTERTYWSAHIGAGYDFNIGGKYTLTPYAKYFVTRLDSHSEGIENNNIHWDDFVMQKTVLGVGFNASWTDRFMTWVDLGWENVFDADSEIKFGQGGSRTDNYEGDNAYLHASVQYRPTDNVMLGIQAQGRAGDYKGFVGLVNAQYLF